MDIQQDSDGESTMKDRYMKFDNVEYSTVPDLCLLEGRGLFGRGH